MTAVATPVPAIDPRSKRQVARETARNEKQAQRRLTSKGATLVAILIAIL